MGAQKQDYISVAPPTSFIHVDDFTGPDQLAQYLHHLMENLTQYIEYLRWRESTVFIDTKFWCRLCAMLHGRQDHVTWYDDIHAWWSGPRVCMTSHGGQKWTNWGEV